MCWRVGRVRIKLSGDTSVKRFAVFLMVGGANTVLGLSIMFGLNAISHNPYFANVSAYVICFFFSFWAHASITFNDIEGKRKQRIIPYAAVYAIAFLSNYLVLVLALHLTAWSPETIFVLTSGVFALTSYALNKAYVFRRREDARID